MLYCLLVIFPKQSPVSCKNVGQNEVDIVHFKILTSYKGDSGKI